MAAVAARSSIIGALLRIGTPVNTSAALEFLEGLSRDELACIAEFHGACAIEALDGHNVSLYRILPAFFDPTTSDRWRDPNDRAHKTFVLLTWLDFLHLPTVGVRSSPAPAM